MTENAIIGWIVFTRFYGRKSQTLFCWLYGKYCPSKFSIGSVANRRWGYRSTLQRSKSRCASAPFASATELNLIPHVNRCRPISTGSKCSSHSRCRKRSYHQCCLFCSTPAGCIESMSFMIVYGCYSHLSLPWQSNHSWASRPARWSNLNSDRVLAKRLWTSEGLISKVRSTVKIARLRDSWQPLSSRFR
jgi:hypothetical protein